MPERSGWGQAGKVRTRGGRDGELTSTWRSLASELSWGIHGQDSKNGEKSPEAEWVLFLFGNSAFGNPALVAH